MVPNSLRVLNTTDLNIQLKIVEMVTFMCILSQFKNLFYTVTHT